MSTLIERAVLELEAMGMVERVAEPGVVDFRDTRFRVTPQGRKWPAEQRKKAKKAKALKG